MKDDVNAMIISVKNKMILFLILINLSLQLLQRVKQNKKNLTKKSIPLTLAFLFADD